MHQLRHRNGTPIPSRHLQQQNGDKARTAVERIWLEIGAAVEEVIRDYGDDLLVQTCLNGKMDASRLWIQVKGRQGIDLRKREVPIRVRADTGWMVILTDSSRSIRYAPAEDVVARVVCNASSQDELNTASRPVFQLLKLRTSNVSSCGSRSTTGLRPVQEGAIVKC